MENEYDSNNEPLVVNLLADGTTDKSIIDISVALLKNRQVLASQGDSTIALTGLRGESAFFSGVVNGEEVAITVTGNTFEIIYTKLATEQFVSDGYQPKGDYLTAVPDGYAKTSDIPTKPEDIGAQPAGNYALKTEIPNIPVQSVNGKTGAVQLNASDVGALPSTYTPPTQTAAQVGADPKGTAASAVSQHNTADDSHNDIRLELKAINDRLTAFFDSDNQTLDELSEIVTYITNNKSLIDSITTSKVSVADIVNNLTSNVTNKPLSAAQGVALKSLIDGVSNSLANYQPKGNYLTSFTETDPTVPSWAKASSKPSYSKSEVGLGNVDNVKQYSASNPPPYPVTSVNGKTGAVTLDAAAVGALPASTTIPTKVSQLTNDSGFIKSYTETDPTVPSWAKAASKPSYSKSEVGLGNVDNVKQYSASNPPPYPVTSVNGKTGAVTLDAGAVGALPASTTIPTKVSQLQNDVGFLTEISKEEIVQQVIVALGTPVFGRVDADNNIILTGELANGEYIIKYEDADGTVTEIGTLNNVPAPTYTNVLPLAINSDKTPYNGGQGWKTGYRLNSSGAEAAVDDWEVTGYIPITTQDVLYFKNVQWRGNSQKHDYISLCNSNFGCLTSTQVISVFIEQTLKNAGSAPGDYGITVDADNNVVSIDFKKLSTTAYGSVSVNGWAAVKYIRFSCFGITEDSIITKNEPITD